MDIKRKRLYWMCRRGTKELDELTLRYLNQYYDDATPEQQQTFAELLQLPDPDLYRVLSGIESSDNILVNEIAKCIRRSSLD